MARGNADLGLKSGSDSFVDLVRLFKRGVTCQEDAAELQAQLQRVVGATSVVFGTEERFAGWGIESGVPDDWRAEYERIKALDPAVPTVLGQAPGLWYLVARAPRQHLQNPVFEAFFRAGFSDGAMARVPVPFGSQIIVLFYRQRGLPPFDDEDLALLDLIYPHLVGALGTRYALMALEHPEAPTLGDAAGAAGRVATLSFPGGSIEWSSAARALWQERLGPIGARGWQRIERALLHAATRYHASGLLGRLQRLAGGIRVEFANVPALPGERWRVLAVFIDETADRFRLDAPPSPAEQLLSPRQRHVARLAANDASVASISGVLGLRPETVRTHLRAVYRRLGVASRGELRAVLALDE
jgi:DNA-binding CsgD family transcriptional regulator